MSQIIADFFKEVIGVLKISMSWHTRLAAETYPADEGFLQVAVNRGGVSEITRKNSNSEIIIIIIIIIIMESQHKLQELENDILRRHL
jgi:hypothetical protein